MTPAAEAKRTVVIVGASDKPHRASLELLQRLLADARYQTVLVHPRLREIEGRPVLPSLAEVPPRPELVTLYVNAGISASMEADLKRLRPKKVIFNPGAENPALMESLKRDGIGTEEACSLVQLSQNGL